MALTINEIARLANVSAATVSRVFSGKGYVSEETRKKIIKISNEKNFKPKQYKVKERSEFCSTVGVVIPDICNNYYMEVIHGFESVMNGHGVDVLICNTDEDPQKEIRCLSMLRRLPIEGIIAVPVSDAEKYNADYLIEMNNSDIPVVLLDRDLRSANIDGVFMDNFNSAYQSIQTFIDNGHTDIAIISGPETSTSGLARLNGYISALEANHIPVRQEYVLQGDFKFELAYELTKKLIGKKTDVTAIFASNSRMAMGCLLALAECRISIPEDMAFISCGKLGVEYGCISSVEYPTSSIGAECAKILLEKMQTKKVPRSKPKRRITFDMELILRGSEVFPTNKIKRKGLQDDRINKYLRRNVPK